MMVRCFDLTAEEVARFPVEAQTVYVPGNRFDRLVGSFGKVEAEAVVGCLMAAYQQRFVGYTLDGDLTEMKTRLGEIMARAIGSRGQFELGLAWLLKYGYVEERRFLDERAPELGVLRVIYPRPRLVERLLECGLLVPLPGQPMALTGDGVGGQREE